jgi:glycosyltransferase involved in cell wall biosynthesis
MSPLIVFSHWRWNFVCQRPQQLMSRLTGDRRVLFIEEPILDANAAPRIEARWEGVRGAEVEVLVPFTPVDASGVDDAQLAVLLPLLEREFARREVVDPLVWLYTPMALPLMAGLHPSAVIYDCMDEPSAFHHAPTPLAELAERTERERALMARADLVLCGGPSLYESRAGQHANLHCLPSAVDPAHFAAASLRDDDPMAARATALQGDLPRPRLGYFGVIDGRMDLDLVAALAEARPDWKIIMAGPVATIDEASLPRRPNLHWLGMQSYAQLPYLLAGWDLCLMPFALNASTRFISPTMTLEYLAGGKPVVSTAIGDVISLYGGAVRIGRDAPGFIAACDAVLYESPRMHATWQKAAAAAVAAGTWDGAADRVRGWLAGLPAAAPPVGRNGDATPSGDPLTAARRAPPVPADARARQDPRAW